MEFSTRSGNIIKDETCNIQLKPSQKEDELAKFRTELPMNAHSNIAAAERERIYCLFQ